MGVSPRGTSSTTLSVKVRMNSACPAAVAAGPYTATLRSITSWPSQIGHKRMQPAAIASSRSCITGFLSTRPVAMSTVRDASRMSPTFVENVASRSSIVSTHPAVTSAP